MNKDYIKEIEVYYDECNRDYEIVLQLKDAMALHYGFWDINTLTHRQALWNLNYQIANHAQIKSTEYVLDAGCGVGGTSIFLANNIGCKVHGISLSPFQIEKAKNNKSRFDKNNLSEFSCQNYCKTNFKDNTFDVIFGIESICYSEPKEDFLKEAFRILKPGGRLIVADFFLRNANNKNEQELINKWEKTWAIKSFINNDQFCEDIKKTGFTNTLIKDISENVYPSIKLLHRSYYPGIFISRISNFFGFRTKAQVENSKCGKYQYVCFEKKIWKYKFLLTFKPPLDLTIPTSSFDQYIKNGTSINQYIDNQLFIDRFPVISQKGISLRNIMKRIMHYYLETNIGRSDKRF